MREKFGKASFLVLRRPGEPLHPFWTHNPVVRERLIPGSFETIRHNMGGYPSTITLRLRLDSMSDFMALQSMLQRTDTLVTKHRFANVRGTTLFEDGEVWEYLDTTTLDDLSEPEPRINGMVEVLATFKRPFNPATGRAD